MTNPHSAVIAGWGVVFYMRSDNSFLFTYHHYLSFVQPFAYFPFLWDAVQYILHNNSPSIARNSFYPALVSASRYSFACIGSSRIPHHSVP